MCARLSVALHQAVGLTASMPYTISKEGTDSTTKPSTNRGIPHRTMTAKLGRGMASLLQGVAGQRVVLLQHPAPYKDFAYQGSVRQAPSPRVRT